MPHALSHCSVVWCTELCLPIPLPESPSLQRVEFMAGRWLFNEVAEKLLWGLRMDVQKGREWDMLTVKA